jgi:dipeptidyl-peptidase 4
LTRSVRLFGICLFASSLFAQTQPQVPTIEAIFAEGGITGRAPESVQWSPDDSKFSFIQRDDSGEQGELWYVDAATGDKRVMVSEVKLAALAPPTTNLKDEREKERLTRYHVEAYQWAPDSKHLLFNSQGQLWYFSLENGTAIQITSDPDPASDPKFSPDGKRLAYVRKHNVYVRPLSGGRETRLTKDKDENILNGEVDWVYAEELTARSHYFWSPDGKDIAFLQMDETRVPTYPIVDWRSPHASVDMQKYPQAGDPNPAVRIGVVSSNGGKTKWISLTEEKDIYIPRFKWIREGLLSAEVMNRQQDKLDLYFVDTHSGKSRKVLAESVADAWVNVNDDFNVMGGNRFVWSSWRDGHTHLYLYSFDPQNPLAAEAKLEKQLTQGDFEVLGVDSVTADKVYFSCNKDDPRQKQLYSVKLDGSDFKKISTEEGTHKVKFAHDSRHYVDDLSAVLTPPSLSICAASAPCRRVWEPRAVDVIGLIPPKFMEFKADDGTTLYGQLLLPPKPGTKVPVIVHIYGGPAAQVVEKAWGGTTLLFNQILLSHGFAVFSVDNRGTPGRGRKFSTAIRREFGEVELKDQIASLDQLFAQNPQLDRDRVAIWGWSNGGSMTLYALTHSDRFKAGVSVAPVTDWHNYDSIYTERLMGLPDANQKLYTETSLVEAARNLHGALLLVHGTSDDNVHFQNSIQMVEGLIKAGKQFRFMPYPGKTHGIGGSDDRNHLFHMIEDCFVRELK